MSEQVKCKYNKECEGGKECFHTIYHGGEMKLTPSLGNEWLEYVSRHVEYFYNGDMSLGNFIDYTADFIEKWKLLLNDPKSKEDKSTEELAKYDESLIEMITEAGHVMRQIGRSEQKKAGMPYDELIDECRARGCDTKTTNRVLCCNTAFCPDHHYALYLRTVNCIICNKNLEKDNAFRSKTDPLLSPDLIKWKHGENPDYKLADDEFYKEKDREEELRREEEERSRYKRKNIDEKKEDEDE